MYDVEAAHRAERLRLTAKMVARDLGPLDTPAYSRVLLDECMHCGLSE